VARARKEGKSKRNRGNQVKRIKMIENNIKILNSFKKELKESK
jgi:hypothetical protein